MIFQRTFKITQILEISKYIMKVIRQFILNLRKREHHNHENFNQDHNRFCSTYHFRILQ